MSRSLKGAVLAVYAALAFSTRLLAKDAAPVVYTGTLGTQSIVMEIKTGDDGHIEGSYFYTKHHRDLALEGHAQKNSIELSEGESDDTSALPQIDLTHLADGSWSGTWHSPKGLSLPVSLQMAKVAAPAADADRYLQELYRSNLYEYLRLSGLTLQKGRKESFMGHTLQWWVEPDSKITLFEILDGYPDAQRKKINEVLRSREWAEVSAFHECMLNGSRYGGDFEQTVTPHLLSPNAVSISIFISYDCGGPHPDFGDAPINLDVHTAQPLELEDVLWVGKGKPFHYPDMAKEEGLDIAQPQSVSFDTFSKYRKDALAPWLAQQLTAIYPSRIKDDDCDYSNPSVWQFPSWHLTSKGISFVPSFSRAERVCEANDDWSVIPYSVTNKHPGGMHMTLP